MQELERILGAPVVERARGNVIMTAVGAEVAAVDYVHGDDGLLTAPIFAVPRLLARNEDLELLAAGIARGSTWVTEAPSPQDLGTTVDDAGQGATAEALARGVDVVLVAGGDEDDEPATPSRRAARSATAPEMRATAMTAKVAA